MTHRTGAQSTSQEAPAAVAVEPVEQPAVEVPAAAPAALAAPAPLAAPAALAPGDPSATLNVTIVSGPSPRTVGVMPPKTWPPGP